uniref:Polycystin cation channel PKD1/PKD2 domain-containing protein n=1 Tax=Bicosoecida sp. CB-2014 TaxID=1486930 RepID=A0A7S1CC16_9STRA|mmetsp:Transcript_19188/g.67718  ORF Transcript_19188/g.67718 Transcript_19188/m.67718 type:complete len:783 (+) Transcript_19188:256-2604(+)
MAELDSKAGAAGGVGGATAGDDGGRVADEPSSGGAAAAADGGGGAGGAALGATMSALSGSSKAPGLGAAKLGGSKRWAKSIGAVRQEVQLKSPTNRHSASFYAMVSESTKVDPELKKRISATRQRCQEICVYLLFLFFFTMSAVLVVQDQTTYHFGNNIRSQLTTTAFDRDHTYVTKNFADVATIEEMFQWLEGPFFRSVYSSDTFTGDFTPLGGGPTGRAGSPEAPVDTPPLSVAEQRGFLFSIDKIVGGIRVSTLRSQQRECQYLPPLWSWKDDAHRPTCYGGETGAFSDETELKEPFGDNGYTFNWDGSGWGDDYQSVQVQRDSALPVIRTSEGNWFPIPAYAVILPNSNATEAWEKLQAIKNGGYIDRHTRLFAVELSVYNPMIDFLCNLRLTVTFPKAGGLLPSSDMDVVRLYRWFETSRPLFIFFEIVTAVFYLYYFGAAMAHLRQVGFKKAFQPETLVQNLNIGFYFVVWMLRGLSIAWAPPMNDVIVDSDTFYSFRSAAVYKALSLYCNACNAFLAWFKLTSYLSYFPRFALVTGTLRRSLQAVGGFIVIFCVLFYGFSAAHMMTFGPSLEGYRNMMQTAFSLLRALLGDFDLGALEEAQYVMGPLLFILFTAMAVFVVLNLLIAIISDAYSDQQAELLAKDGEDALLAKELREYFSIRLSKLPCMTLRMRAHLLNVDVETARRIPHRGCCAGRGPKTVPAMETVIEEDTVDEFVEPTDSVPARQLAAKDGSGSDVDADRLIAEEEARAATEPGSVDDLEKELDSLVHSQDGKA